MKQESRRDKAGKGLRPLTPSERPFEKTNYMMMGVCLVLIVVGFALMAGPGSSEATGFNPDIFSTRRIVVGPTIAFLGFLLMAFAIIWKPKKRTGMEEVAESSVAQISEEETKITETSNHQ